MSSRSRRLTRDYDRQPRRLRRKRAPSSVLGFICVIAVFFVMREILPRLHRSSSYSGGAAEQGAIFPAYLFPFIFLGFIALFFGVVIWMFVSNSRDRRRARERREEEVRAYWEALESAERSARTALVDADTAVRQAEESLMYASAQGSDPSSMMDAQARLAQARSQVAAGWEASRRLEEADTDDDLARRTLIPLMGDSAVRALQVMQSTGNADPQAAAALTLAQAAPWRQLEQAGAAFPQRFRSGDSAQSGWSGD